METVTVRGVALEIGPKLDDQNGSEFTYSMDAMRDVVETDSTLRVHIDGSARSPPIGEVTDIWFDEERGICYEADVDATYSAVVESNVIAPVTYHDYRKQIDSMVVDEFRIDRLVVMPESIGGAEVCKMMHSQGES